MTRQILTDGFTLIRTKMYKKQTRRQLLTIKFLKINCDIKSTAFHYLYKTCTPNLSSISNIHRSSSTDQYNL